MLYHNRVMHDEVSDTENIRKNLAIERTIVEGCDILLDTSQTFIRQGKTLLCKSVHAIVKKNRTEGSRAHTAILRLGTASILSPPLVSVGCDTKCPENR